MFFTLIFGDNILYFYFSKLFEDETFREKLAPTSPNGPNIQYAAVNSVHCCTF